MAVSDLEYSTCCDICTFTYAVLRKPMVHECGNSVCEVCLKTLKSCPTCRAPLTHVFPNLGLLRLIEDLHLGSEQDTTAAACASAAAGVLHNDLPASLPSRSSFRHDGPQEAAAAATSAIQLLYDAPPKLSSAKMAAVAAASPAHGDRAEEQVIFLCSQLGFDHIKTVAYYCGVGSDLCRKWIASAQDVAQGSLAQIYPPA